MSRCRVECILCGKWWNWDFVKKHFKVVYENEFGGSWFCECTGNNPLPELEEP